MTSPDFTGAALSRALRDHLLSASIEQRDELECAQLDWADRVERTALPGTPRFVCGVDVAYARDGRTALAASVMLDRHSGAWIAHTGELRSVRFPYVPGLFAYREANLMAEAVAALEDRAGHACDLVMCDGNGTLHPRGFGVACAVGLLLDRPTVGVSKNAPLRAMPAPAPLRGATVDVALPPKGRGVACRTASGVKPVFVSVGHRVTTGDAVDQVLDLARHRVPEPIGRADRACRRALADVLDARSP